MKFAKTAILLGVLCCIPLQAAESLQTKVTLEGDNALTFFKSLNVKDETRVVNAGTAHLKKLSINSETTVGQLYIICNYLETKEGKIPNPTCDFSFYVNTNNDKK